MLGIIISGLCGLVFALVCYRFVWIPYSLRRKMIQQGLTGPSFIPFIGELKTIKKYRDTANFWPLALFQNYFSKYGKNFVYCLGPDVRVCLADPKHVQQVLISKNDCYEKPNLMINLMRLIFGNGILLSSGAMWKSHRSMMDPAFSYSSLQKMHKLMESVVIEHMAVFEDYANKNKEINAHEEVSHMTLNVIGAAAFGQDIGGSSDTAKEIYHEVGDLLNGMYSIFFSGLVFVPHYDKLPIPSVRKIMKKRDKIAEVVLKAIKERRSGVTKAPQDRCDILQLILNATDDKDGQMSDEELLHEALTFFIAGYETTAQMITWTMYVLAQHPEWMHKVQLEVDELFKTGQDIASAELKDLTCVVYESMRLYPPVPLIARKCVKDHELEGGFRMYKGMSAAIPIFAIHRDEAFYDNPDQFLPERFEHGISQASKKPHAYLPFSNGPRICIGKKFAFVEGKIALCHLIRRFEWRVSENYEHDPYTAITLRPKTGMQLYMSKRKHI